MRENAILQALIKCNCQSKTHSVMKRCLHALLYEHADVICTDLLRQGDLGLLKSHFLPPTVSHSHHKQLIWLSNKKQTTKLTFIFSRGDDL